MRNRAEAADGSARLMQRREWKEGRSRASTATGAACKLASRRSAKVTARTVRATESRRLNHSRVRFGRYLTSHLPNGLGTAVLLSAARSTGPKTRAKLTNEGTDNSC